MSGDKDILYFHSWVLIYLCNILKDYIFIAIYAFIKN